MNTGNSLYEQKPPGWLASIFISGWPIFLIVLAVFFSGLLVGSISSSKMDKPKTDELSIYVSEFLQRAGEINFDSKKIAKNAIINNVIIVASIYLLGLTVIGIPMTLAILFVRGFVIGFAVGFLTRDLSIEGIFLSITAILPHNLLYIPAICFGAASSMMFALHLSKRNSNRDVRIWPGFLKYTAVMTAVLLITMVAGLVEGYVTPLFTKIAAGIISSGNPTH